MFQHWDVLCSNNNAINHGRGHGNGLYWFYSLHNQHIESNLYEDGYGHEYHGHAEYVDAADFVQKKELQKVVIKIMFSVFPYLLVSWV